MLLTYGRLCTLVSELHAYDAVIKLLDEADDALVRLRLLEIRELFWSQYNFAWRAKRHGERLGKGGGNVWVKMVEGKLKCVFCILSVSAMT